MAKVNIYFLGEKSIVESKKDIDFYLVLNSNTVKTFGLETAYVEAIVKSLTKQIATQYINIPDETFNDLGISKVCFYRNLHSYKKTGFLQIEIVKIFGKTCFINK